MKIVKLETFTKPYVSFVKITVEDGSIGYGQMSTIMQISQLKFFINK